jgi:hypothetical protein
MSAKFSQLSHCLLGSFIPGNNHKGITTDTRSSRRRVSLCDASALMQDQRGNMNSKRVMTAVLASAVIFTAQAKASDDGAGTGAGQEQKKTRPSKKHESSEAQQLRELRDQMKQQQQEIEDLKGMLAGKTQQAQGAQQAAADAQAQASQAAQAATQASQAAAQATQAATDAATKADAASATATDVKTKTADLQEQVVSNQAQVQQELHEPASIHYKGVEITPGGFVAAEGVYRQHSVNSDINTPFNSIPLPSASEGHTSELNFSGRQSRLSVLVSGDTGKFRLSGYYEMDFLGTGTSSNNNQSNSYVLRQRQIWGKVETQSGFAMTGGQMWSLVTEDRRGTDTRTEIQPQTIDPQYLVGYSWERQPGFRFQKRFGNYNTGAFTMAIAEEQAQITSFTANGTNPTDYFFGGPGQNGGLYNAAGNIGAGNVAGTAGITTYANNLAPDTIVKFAYDQPLFHIEIGGLARWFRDSYIPVTYGGTASAPTFTYAANGVYQTHTATGGGVFGAARVYVGKISEIAVQAMAGQGVGRYGSSQLADVTLRPDETLEPIRNYHGLFSWETHLSPKWDVFAYYGGEYAQRTVYQTPAGNLIGYGPNNLSDAGCYNLPAAVSTGTGSGGSISASTCGSPTRYIQEAMGGITWKPINSPRYGRLQYSATYSYIQRNLWSGVGSATTPSGPRATEPMVHVQMRYYIP